MSRRSTIRPGARARGSAALGALTLGLLLAPAAASGQGAEAKGAYARLLPLSGGAGFPAAVSAELGRLISVEDAAWLTGALASESKDAAQRKALLTERASMLELLGRYRDAAAAWESAAGALPGVADPACLLSAAACRLAAGEGEAAAELAKALSFASPDAVSARLGGLVSGWAALARGDRGAALLAAKAGLEHPDRRVALSALFLAKASADGSELAEYEKRLAALGPRPEAASSSTLLLLLGSPRPSEAKPTAPAAIAPAPSGGTEALYYQVGAFRDEANARALAKKIEALGLSPRVKARPSGDLYVVYVEPGADAGAAILALKDAGYEAWAVEGTP